MKEIGASRVESVNGRASLQHLPDCLSRSYAVFQSNMNFRAMSGPDKCVKGSI